MVAVGLAPTVELRADPDDVIGKKHRSDELSRAAFDGFKLARCRQVPADKMSKVRRQILDSIVSALGFSPFRIVGFVFNAENLLQLTV